MSIAKWRSFQAGVFGLALLSAHPALAANAARGKVLAEHWCVSCHVVAAGQTSATASSAPTFMWLAKSSKSEKALKAFLIAPHPPMPNLSLSRREINDVVAYIESLKSSE